MKLRVAILFFIRDVFLIEVSMCDFMVCKVMPFIGYATTTKNGQERPIKCNFSESAIVVWGLSQLQIRNRGLRPAGPV